MSLPTPVGLYKMLRGHPFSLGWGTLGPPSLRERVKIWGPLEGKGLCQGGA